MPTEPPNEDNYGCVMVMIALTSIVVATVVVKVSEAWHPSEHQKLESRIIDLERRLDERGIGQRWERNADGSFTLKSQ